MECQVFEYCHFMNVSPCSLPYGGPTERYSGKGSRYVFVMLVDFIDVMGRSLFAKDGNGGDMRERSAA